VRDFTRQFEAAGAAPTADLIEEVAHRVVAFVTSFAIALLGMGAVIWFGKRRPVGAPLTWGEAIAAATFAFALMFWAYGVVPHQWLQWANNELGWTPSKKLLGPNDVLKDQLPFTLDYEKLRDVVVVGIYGLFLTAHVSMWAMWQDRAKKAEAKKQRELAPSTYGRPLVKQP
jgi:heme A synthase